MITQTPALRGRVLVTGGAGFIGSALVRRLVATSTVTRVVNVDALTYAGNLDSLPGCDGCPQYVFEWVDVTDRAAVVRTLEKHEPDVVFHLAAESHVDRSIDAPERFVVTNVVGTYNVLDAALEYWKTNGAPDTFRFVHVSTDEVFGSLGDEGYFTEETPYAPRSPYSASKAGADHLARAWFHTYALPVIVTNCSNNYGPFQFPEKLIPVVIERARAGDPIPVYGRGENIRDWLYVEDHVDALVLAAVRGKPGRTYAIGGGSERRNIDVVRTVCAVLDRLDAAPHGYSYADQITYVDDRPGHDYRYAIDASLVRDELGWGPQETFETGIARTVRWYLDNQEWCERVTSGVYRGERLGLKRTA